MIKFSDSEYIFCGQENPRHPSSPYEDMRLKVEEKKSKGLGISGQTKTYVIVGEGRIVHDAIGAACSEGKIEPRAAPKYPVPSVARALGIFDR